MTPSNGLIKFPSYSAEATMAYGSLDEFEASYNQNFQDGFQPLQTYPAKFHNTVVKFLFQQAQQTYLLCSSIFSELSNAITGSGQELDATDLNQLKKAITRLSELQVATATVLGGVKSSAASWKVAVDIDGVMSVNTTTASASVAGLVKLGSAASGGTDALSTGAAYTALAGKKNTQTAVSSPTASGTATAFIDTISQNAQGVITATKKNVTFPSWYIYLKIASGKLYAAINSTGTTPSGYTPGATGVTLPSSPTHVESATYLRPADSTSTLVTADAQGNLTAHSLSLS